MIQSLQYLNGGSANHWGSSRRVMPSFASLVFARLPLDVHLQCKVNQYIEIKQQKHKDGQVILSVIPSQHPFVLTVQGSSSSSSLCWEGGLPKSGLVDIAIAKRLALVPKSGFNKAPLQTQNKSSRVKCLTKTSSNNLFQTLSSNLTWLTHGNAMVFFEQLQLPAWAARFQA